MSSLQLEAGRVVGTHKTSVQAKREKDISREFLGTLYIDEYISALSNRVEFLESCKVVCIASIIYFIVHFKLNIKFEGMT